MHLHSGKTTTRELDQQIKKEERVKIREELIGNACFINDESRRTHLAYSFDWHYINCGAYCC